MENDKLIGYLNECLLTDEEMALGIEGWKKFNDPLGEWSLGVDMEGEDGEEEEDEEDDDEEEDGEACQLEEDDSDEKEEVDDAEAGEEEANEAEAEEEEEEPSEEEPLQRAGGAKHSPAATVGHKYGVQTFRKPTFCDHCRKLLIGFRNQGPRLPIFPRIAHHLTCASRVLCRVCRVACVVLRVSRVW